MEGLAGVDGCLGFFAGALQAREALENRHADFFSAAGVDGGLDDHQVTGLECLADQFAGRFQVAQIRAFVALIGVGTAIMKMRQSPRSAGWLLKRSWVASARPSGLHSRELSRPRCSSSTRLVDIEPQGRAQLPECQRQRQADVAQTDDGDFGVGKRLLEVRHGRRYAVDSPVSEYARLGV